MHDPLLFAVIMAGGSGTRFWPASRRTRPKQFLPVGGDRPLLARTLERLRGLVALEHTLVVTSAAHVDLVRDLAPELPPANVLAEPEGRNTAPCIAWAAWEIERRAPEAVQLVLPADHVIEPTADFQRSVRAAVRHAAAGDRLLTFGIRPTHPATGFGYIEPGALATDVDGFAIHAVERFVEKPDAERAAEFVERGFLWNAGIFLWSTRAIQSAIARFLPEARAALAALEAHDRIEDVWSRMPAQPVDVAILERARNVDVLPVSYAWNDVGSWTALPEVVAADEAGNVVSGGARFVGEDARDCIVYGEAGRLTALIGVEGLVVVQAGDAVLVCPRERAQEVKRIVERLGQTGPDFL